MRCRTWLLSFASVMVLVSQGATAQMAVVPLNHRLSGNIAIPVLDVNDLRQTAPKATDAGIEQALTQIEKEWAAAYVKNDAAALDRIIADDWIEINADAKTGTKAELIDAVKSGKSTTQTNEIGTTKVRVFGDMAIVNGTSTTKSSEQGRDTSGQYVWTDIFARRNGRWQVVSSQATKVK
jgi:ketosteroid isomerase-like protein